MIDHPPKMAGNLASLAYSQASKPDADLETVETAIRLAGEAAHQWTKWAENGDLSESVEESATIEIDRWTAAVEELATKAAQLKPVVAKPTVSMRQVQKAVDAELAALMAIEWMGETAEFVEIVRTAAKRAGEAAREYDYLIRTASHDLEIVDALIERSNYWAVQRNEFNKIAEQAQARIDGEPT